MSAFERFAVQRLLDQAADLGVELPAELRDVGALFHDAGTWPARRWAELNPRVEPESAGCCWGEVHRGHEHCLCWIAEFDVEQAEPRPPTGPADIAPEPTMCGDCAFRPGSPERADEWMASALYASASEGKPFFCHRGMRRPVRWRHPDGRVVDGSRDDWQPPMVRGLPYQADGSPGRLCTGWAAVAGHTHSASTSPEGIPE